MAEATVRIGTKRASDARAAGSAEPGLRPDQIDDTEGQTIAGLAAVCPNCWSLNMVTSAAGDYSCWNCGCIFMP